MSSQQQQHTKEPHGGDIVSSSNNNANRNGYPKLRFASYSELPAIAHLMSLAFWDDALCGQRIHPHRDEDPEDVDLYWLRRARVNFWDWRWRWVVAVVESGGDGDGDDGGDGAKEAIAGIAQW